MWDYLPSMAHIVWALFFVFLFSIAYELFLRRLSERFTAWRQRKQLPMKSYVTKKESRSAAVEALQEKLNEASGKKQEQIQEEQRKKAIDELELAKSKPMKNGNILNPSATKAYAADTGTVLSSSSSSFQSRRDRLVLEQDAEYNASLSKDQEKELRKRIIQEREDVRRKEEEMKKQDEEKLKKSRDAYLESLFSQLPAEESDSSPLKCKITIRMPQGDRISRTFSSENTLKNLFDFIESQGFMEVNQKYELVALYPRRVYGMEEYRSIGDTFKKIGFKHNEVVYFQEAVQSLANV